MSLHPVFLLITSALLLWRSWPLRASANADQLAAPLASALMMLAAALMAIIWSAMPSLNESTDAQQFYTLLEQLAFYAALPLLVCHRLAQGLGFIWNRMIWGRILLALCAMFALLRTNGGLDIWLWIVLAAGLLAFALPFTKAAFRQHWSYTLVSVMFWGFVLMSFTSLELNHGSTDYARWSWLGFALVPFSLPCQAHSQS